jgi:hypothetical protein
MQTSPVKPAMSMWEGATPVLMARIVDSDDDYVLQAGVTSIAYSVIDLQNSHRVVGSGSLAAADVIFDTLQTGHGWTYVAGYNFRWKVPAASFPAGEGCYRVEVEITAGGVILPLVADVEVAKRYS